MLPHRAVESIDLGRAHQHVDIGSRVAAGPELGGDRGTLDVQEIDAELVGEVLDGRVSEAQAHRQRHADLGFAHARCTTSPITLSRRTTCASSRIPCPARSGWDVDTAHLCRMGRRPP